MERSRIWYRYGLTEDDYQSKLDEQGGLCAVCRTTPKENRPLCVDHSHKAGHNRGLLCDSCNLILGFAKDSQGLLRRLIVYLQKHDGEKNEFTENNPEAAASREKAWEFSLS